MTHLRFAPGGLADLKGVLIERLKARSASGLVPLLRGNLLERALQRCVIGRADFLGGFDEPLRLFGVVWLWCWFARHYYQG